MTCATARDVTKPAARDNHTWPAHLCAGGQVQQAALQDLRDALLRGLRRGLAGYPQCDAAFLDDVVQDALVRVLERLEQFAGRSRFETWATSIALRLAFSELRRKRWRDVSLDALLAPAADSAPLEAASQRPRAASGLERRTLVGAMYDVIHRQLTDLQRTALLAELKGMPQSEIARHLGSNRNAVYKLTHDARKRLKRGLEDAGYHAEHVRSAFTP